MNHWGGAQQRQTPSISGGRWPVAVESTHTAVEQRGSVPPSGQTHSVSSSLVRWVLSARHPQVPGTKSGRHRTSNQLRQLSPSTSKHLLDSDDTAGRLPRKTMAPRSPAHPTGPPDEGNRLQARDAWRRNVLPFCTSGQTPPMSLSARQLAAPKPLQ